MRALRISLLFLHAFVAVVAIGLLPSTAAAQFETPSRAFHNSTAFRLEGRHQAVPCSACHLNGQYAGTPTTCVQCHWIRRKDDRFQTKLGSECQSCHRPTSWTAVSFSHAPMAGQPLGAAHRRVACESCHRDGNFTPQAADCQSCHKKDYDATQSPNHAAAGFPTTCESCHRPNDTVWQSGGGTGGAGFNHNSVFQLVGRHATATCATCHKNNIYRGTARDCVGCHQANYNSTRNPNHITAGFPTTCDSCHRPTDASWTGNGATAAFNHNAVFQLVGTHSTQTCAACHKNNVYRGTSRDCVGCHLTNYQNTRSPNHASAGLPTTCESCHRATDASWSSGSGFNHNAVFGLVGTHATVQCAACHKNNVYRGTARDCVGCHLTNYQNTRNPNHASAGLPTTCESCHRATDTSWSSGGGFNHNAVFSLVGRHATAQCATCHANNVYRGTPRDCVGCHQTQYNNTRSPNHASAGFSTQCESCHRPTDNQWTGVTFNHNAVFALVGRHAAAQCATCHVNNTYRGTPRDCVGCHLTQYNNTRSPSHASAGFSTQCESCHRPTDNQWTGVTFNHNAVFALVGTHATQACAACHVNNIYRGTPRDCVGCHLPRYQQTTAPNHAAAGFPTTCDTCHRATDTRWTGVTFTHSTFQLQGVHATQTCASCHRNNVYAGTARDCAGCHITRYNATTNPNHSSAGFPTTCETCHRATDTSWNQGRFTHTQFPITSGRHNVPCAQCHTTPNNFRVFSCTTCHTRSETDNEHRGRSGYVYDSNACYSCHPNGRS